MLIYERVVDIIWLVVLKNTSQIGSSSQLLGNIKNSMVPNHQPDTNGYLLAIIYFYY